jgi:hypothetical protein
MHIFRIWLAICSFAGAVVGLMVFSAGASATAQRTFVGSAGNDANPCSMVAPCRSFAVAMSQTTGGGEIIVLDSAGYAPVTIDRSVSIVAPDGVYAGITAFAGDGIDITAFNLRVLLRGLTINALGGANGIAVQAGLSDIRVERVAISGFTSAGIDANAGALGGARLYVRDSVISRNTTGVTLGAFSSFVDDSSAMEVMLDRVSILENSYAGVELSKGAKVHIRDSVIERNAVAGVFMEIISSGDLFLSLTIERSTIRRNASGIHMAPNLVAAGSPMLVSLSETIVGDNTGVGIDVACLGAAVGKITIADALISGNGGAGILGTGAGCAFTVSHNVIVGNGGTSMVNASAGSFASFGDNRVRGNGTDPPSGTITLVPTR